MRFKDLPAICSLYGVPAVFWFVDMTGTSNGSVDEVLQGDGKRRQQSQRVFTLLSKERHIRCKNLQHK